jgi:dTDP-4-amino-4,6-dideoxygalactose transaminase
MASFLKEKRIGALVHYPVPVHMQPAYRGRAAARLPHTERAVSEVLSLPIYPELAENEVDFVAGEVRAFCRASP